MTVEEVKRRVAAIRRIRSDDEKAHNAEDLLHEDVLRAIVAGTPNPEALAAAALETTEIPFSRWCA